MSDKANLYVVLGLSSNNIVESVMFEGYNTDDVHFYIMNNYAQLENKYPFIYNTAVTLLSIYKKQYKMDPNLNNFKVLVENSDELGNNFIKIVEFSQQSIVNACSYYQNNKKTIALKTQTITIKDLSLEITQTQDKTEQLPVSSLKSKISIKKKIT